MNMFRNLLCLFLIFFGTSMLVSNPSDWPLLQRGGPDLLNVLHVCETFRPFVVIACYVMTLALFLTRKIY